MFQKLFKKHTHVWEYEATPIRGSECDEDSNGRIAWSITRCCFGCRLYEDLGETRDTPSERSWTVREE